MTNTPPSLCVLANSDKSSVPGCVSDCYVVSVVLCQNLSPSLPFCRKARANVEIIGASTSLGNSELQDIEQLLVFAYFFFTFQDQRIVQLLASLQ